MLGVLFVVVGKQKLGYRVACMKHLLLLGTIGMIQDRIRASLAEVKHLFWRKKSVLRVHTFFVTEFSACYYVSKHWMRFKQFFGWAGTDRSLVRGKGNRNRGHLTDAVLLSP